MQRLQSSVDVRLLAATASVFFVLAALAITDSGDVKAVKKFFGSLNYPLPPGDDPCGDSWSEVQCLSSNIMEIRLGRKNIHGELGESLGEFGNIVTIDLKLNHINGRIPLNLPRTLRNIDFSDNQLSGSIPKNLSSLNDLQTLSFSRNRLEGPIPDSFQHLTKLTNLYLSNNNLRGELPPSMEYLSALSTLHLQNNQLTGKLEVLQNLHLRDLNIENNHFSGPIPKGISSISNFSYRGNQIDPTALPSPGAESRPQKAPSPGTEPGWVPHPPPPELRPSSPDSASFTLYAPPPPRPAPHHGPVLPSVFKVLVVLLVLIASCFLLIVFIRKGTTPCRKY